MAQKQHAALGRGICAILLVTRSRPGPKLVFHYPQLPSVNTRLRSQSVVSDDSATDTDGEDLTSTTEASHVHINGNIEPTHILGHCVDSLEKLLTPGRWCDSKKFELYLDGLTFVGHPVYALEDGRWDPAAPEPKTIASAPLLSSKAHYGEYHMYLDPGSVSSTPPGPISSSEKFKHVPDSLDSHAFGTSLESTSTSSGQGAEQISMFHVVLVLDTRRTNGQHHVSTMYTEVARKLSLALQHLQKQGNYVAAECRRLQSLKTKAKQKQQDGLDLWKQMVETSELAWALKEIYDKIYIGDAAGIRLNGMEMSLHTGYLEDEQAENASLAPLSALLLLESKDSLLSQLSHPDASPLANFIRGHLPTKDLQKHSNNLGIPINDILHFASHLIQWRKARIITPLHQRNTYVVSPTAPLDDLRSLIDKYSKTFPTLPSLPSMLKVLSGKPIKYILLIPSRDHRGAYMEILSFLVQHRLVVQLRTCGWLRLPKSILKAPPVLVDQQHLDPNKRPLPLHALLSPRLKPVEDDDVSVSSERTAIPAAFGRAGKRLSTGTQVSLHSHSNSQDNKTDDGGEEAVLMADPANLTAEQEELLQAARRSLTNVEMRERFMELVGFFDGESAFEGIAARLGLKRATVEEWVGIMEERGWVMSTRVL